VRTPDNHGIPRPGPLPGTAIGLPDAAGDEDAEWAQYTAWLDREAAAGREPEPDPWVLDDAESWDPELDAPGLAGPAPADPVTADPGRPLFAQDGAADVMAPSPFLAALTEQAVSDLAGLSDNELVGVLRASQRQIAREQYKQVLAAAEFGRRRQAAFNDALARGVPAGCAAGGFPGEELRRFLVTRKGSRGRLRGGPARCARRPGGRRAARWGSGPASAASVPG
jgi:hypothetical protein